MDLSARPKRSRARRALARLPLIGRRFSGEIDGARFARHEGLPGLMPKGERMIWQGRPHWFTFARTAFLGDWVAIYFVCLAAWRVADGLSLDVPTERIVAETAGLGVMAAVCLGLIGFLGFVTARSTTYTITNRRVAMKTGVALKVTINLPFAQIGSIDLRRQAGGRGDIALTLEGEGRLAYLMLWPHARPWRLSRPQPMLRATPDAARVARLLAEAVVERRAETGVAPAFTAPEPSRSFPAAAPAGVVAAE